MEEHVHCEDCGREIPLSDLRIEDRHHRPLIWDCVHCHTHRSKVTTYQIRLKGVMVKKPKCPYHKGNKCAMFKANDEHPYCEPDDHCKLKYAEGGLI